MTSAERKILLRVALTSEEAEAKGKILANKLEEITHLEIKAKASAATFKERIKEVETFVDEIAEDVRLGTEQRLVVVHERPNYSRRTIEVYRSDTGDLVSFREMTDREVDEARQPGLFPGAARRVETMPRATEDRPVVRDEVPHVPAVRVPLMRDPLTSTIAEQAEEKGTPSLPVAVEEAPPIVPMAKLTDDAKTRLQAETDAAQGQAIRDAKANQKAPDLDTSSQSPTLRDCSVCAGTGTDVDVPEAACDACQGRGFFTEDEQAKGAPVGDPTPPPPSDPATEITDPQAIVDGAAPEPTDDDAPKPKKSRKSRKAGVK